MKTTAARQATLDRIAADIRRCSEAEGRVMHQGNAWQADALERAGDLAMGGRLTESRAAAARARE